jgi:transposase
MEEISTVGLDLAKRVFQVHAANSSGAVVFRKRLRRGQVLPFFATLPPCTVAMEACAGGHYWGREMGKLGHTVRLIAPIYVKPFVKRQKNDAADAEAICEAAQRPTMRFVSVKSEEAQAAAIAFRTRDLMVRQRTQAINALRGHLAEFGVTVAKGPMHVVKLIAVVDDPASGLPETTRVVLAMLLDELRILDAGDPARPRDRPEGQGRRRRAAAHDHPGHRFRDRDRARGPGSAGGDLPAWTGLRRLAWADAATPIDRREAEAWRHLEDGRANSSSPACHWGKRRRAPCGISRLNPRVLAGAHAFAQASHACDGRLSE